MPSLNCAPASTSATSSWPWSAGSVPGRHGADLFLVAKRSSARAARSPLGSAAPQLVASASDTLEPRGIPVPESLVDRGPKRVAQDRFTAAFLQRRGDLAKRRTLGA